MSQNDESGSLETKLNKKLAALPARCFLRRILPGLHFTETILAAGTQRPGKATLLHSSLSGNNGIADLGAVDTSTVGQTGWQHLARTSFGCDNFGGGLDALGDFAMEWSVRHPHCSI